MAARTATLWRLAQDWIDLDTGALLCAAEDLACAGNGAAAVGGRWNSVGRPVIYLADSLALAQLEKRVHTPLRPPRELVAVEVTLPAAAVLEAETLVPPVGWDMDNVDWSVGRTPSQHLGDDWVERNDTLLLRVPSVVVPVGWNYLLNPSHPDARRLRTRRLPYRPDARLW
ncbi:RES family NAD+ phosphorylase [Thauera mechernichensis]|uniref:RES family NAD+ phosphorylase n=1 Tax=Thauera mechernichensis TaxID=82788 RepID=A0ABW3WDD5_9RHOO|nr:MULTISPECIES: RES family NAD+ phosphorylase [Thauera]ENO81363.1 RES domain-containing protein [Thauera sp. 27]MDG3064975.1 RES family NAD+ phosphorylase [Thauera mechernichensis]